MLLRCIVFVPDAAIIESMTDTYRLPEQILTDRFCLRRVMPGDAGAIFQSYSTDEAVTRYLGWKPHRHRDETEAFLKRVSQEWDNGTGFPFAVFGATAPEDLIGLFHPHVRGSTVRYGYVLSRTQWGKGYATAILAWLVDQALSHPQIYRAEAFCDVGNLASARVMEKAGMAREGILKRYFLHPNLSDVPTDCLIYAKV